MQKLAPCLIGIILLSCSTNPHQQRKYPNKLVIAHRGAPGYLPEHTLPGVTMAHTWGVDYIEPDVVMTKDNRLIVLHDIHLDTTTNVAAVYPKKIRKDRRFYAIDFTLNEIKKLKVHERLNFSSKEKVFPKRFPLHKSQFSVPTLVEYIELIQGLNETTGKNIGLYVEYKSPKFHREAGKDIAKKLLAVLQKYGYSAPQSGAIIQCFDPLSLKKLRRQTALPLVQLIAANEWREADTDYDKMMTPAGLKEVASYADGIGPWTKFVLENDQLVKLAKQNGLYVHAYTIRKEQIPVQFKDLDDFHNTLYFKKNIDGLFSDFGDLTLKFLNDK